MLVVLGLTKFKSLSLYLCISLYNLVIPFFIRFILSRLLFFGFLGFVGGGEVNRSSGFFGRAELSLLGKIFCAVRGMRAVCEPIRFGVRPENGKLSGFGFWFWRAENRVEFSIEFIFCLYVGVWWIWSMDKLNCWVLVDFLLVGLRAVLRVPRGVNFSGFCLAQASCLKLGTIFPSWLIQCTSEVPLSDFRWLLAPSSPRLILLPPSRPKPNNPSTLVHLSLDSIMITQQTFKFCPKQRPQTQ